MEFRALFLALLLLDPFNSPVGAADDSEFAAVSLEELEPHVVVGDYRLLDANGSKYFAKGHIPGAIDAAAHTDDLVAVLGENKTEPIVVYCGGADCEAWLAVAEKVRDLGYTDVRHFPLGISGWIEAGKETGRTDQTK